jgi:hypothetical protein
MLHASALLPFFRAIVFTHLSVNFRCTLQVDLRFLKQYRADPTEEKEFGLFVDLLK